MKTISTKFKDGPNHQEFRDKVDTLKKERADLHQAVADAERRVSNGEVTPRFLELAQDRLGKVSVRLNTFLVNWESLPVNCADEDLRFQLRTLKTRIKKCQSAIGGLGRQSQEYIDDAAREKKNIDACEASIETGIAVSSTGRSKDYLDRQQTEQVREDLKRHRWAFRDAESLVTSYREEAVQKAKEMHRLNVKLEKLEAGIREF